MDEEQIELAIDLIEFEDGWVLVSRTNTTQMSDAQTIDSKVILATSQLLEISMESLSESRIDV